jgi:hypothetical protein
MDFGNSEAPAVGLPINIKLEHSPKIGESQILRVHRQGTPQAINWNRRFMTLRMISLFSAVIIVMVVGGPAVAAGALGEDCPQGRQIRAQKSFPSSMSDCDVLDADTAIENQRLRRGSATAIPSANRPPSNNRNEVAQTQAVLYDEDPNSPQGRQYVGSVIWRTEPVKANVGEKADIAVRAEIDIPDRKFKMAMSFRRNNDTSLPASHTAELTFVLPPDFAGGGIGNVPGILMKSNEQARGTALAGLAVKINDSFFMVGLSNVAVDSTRNFKLLHERSWFDIPIVYSNGRRAILAFKKGASGQRVFDQAFTAWNEETGRQQLVAAPAAASDPNSLAVEMSVTATSENPPVVKGTTNLPNGTVLSIFLFGEPPACVPHCGIGPADTVVLNGRFTIGTKLTGTEKLLAAFYKIDVTMMSHGQSDPTVKSAIGPNGENLRGSYVAALGDGPGVGYIPITFPRTSPPSEGERHLGLDIHYTQRVFVASDAASDDAVRSQANADFRKSSVESCRLQTGFRNLATDGELGTAQRQVIMDECIAQSERKLTSAMISPPAQLAQKPPSSQNGHEWMDSAPTFCQSKPYSNLTPKQMNICAEATFRHLSKNWKTLTAENGQAYEIALDTVFRNLPNNLDSRADLRAATVVAYISEGEVFNPENVVHFYFDCHDRFQTFQRLWSQVIYAPPLSIAAKIASIACSQ